jgi:transcriptional regulator with XRE-family HTH domain
MKNSYIISEKSRYIRDMWEIGLRLRQQREKANLKIGQVAEYENISAPYISQLETGVNKPNWDLLARLARRYHTSADYILGLTDDPRPADKGDLPIGGAEILEYLHNMSIRGRDAFMTAARAYYQTDQQWQAYGMVMDALAALPGGYEILDELSEEESVRLTGFKLEGVRLILDSTEHVIRIVPTEGDS